MSKKYKLLSSTVIPVVLGISVAVAATGQAATNAPAAKNPTAVPHAVASSSMQLAACNPCNPCAAKKACNPCNPCNPCAAAACSPCNPCNPCNPCAAGACGPASDCVVPGLASACNPCNPCAAKKAGNPCNPCNPCGAAAAPELSAAEAADAYSCIKGALRAGYLKSGDQWAGAYQSWQLYNTQPYVSDTHGGRFVNNYANARGANYERYEDAGPAPTGTVLAKDSFSVKGNGKVGPGPFFLMEKMAAGFNAASQDWRYTLIMPNGKVVGTTNGAGSSKMQFCAECHLAVEDQDSRFYLPEEYRVK